MSKKLYKFEISGWAVHEGTVEIDKLTIVDICDNLNNTIETKLKVTLLDTLEAQDPIGQLVSSSKVKPSKVMADPPIVEEEEPQETVLQENVYEYHSQVVSDPDDELMTLNLTDDSRDDYGGL